MAVVAARYQYSIARCEKRNDYFIFLYDVTYKVL